MTNLLLFLILIVLLAGFGFIAPIFWFFLALAGLLLFVAVIVVIARGLGRGFGIFADAVDWLIGFLFWPIEYAYKRWRAWFYWGFVLFLFSISIYIAAIGKPEAALMIVVFPAMFSFFGLVGYLDERSVRKKWDRPSPTSDES